MYQIDYGSDVLNWRLLQDAVSEIENMAGVPASAIKYFFYAAFQFRSRC